MYIKELTCRNFRNYENLYLELFPGINILTGVNAVGKTNILESISILSNIRSFRNVPDSEIIKWGEKSYYCSLVLSNASDVKYEIGCVNISNRIKKKAKIDGHVKKKISDYYSKFLTVFLSPDDIALVTGPPELRRKFFDSIISKVDTDYLNSLSEYKRIIALRNKILRDIREKKKTVARELDIWDNMLAERASNILKKRIEFISQFNSWFSDSNREISGNSDSINIEYSSTNSLYEKKNILEALLRTRGRDIFSGSTGTGPHRDDYLLVCKENRIFKNFASQGQKRTACLSLKIAEYKFIEAVKDKSVVLMDDVLGELDENRRNRIMDIIRETDQIIITGVNDPFLKNSNLYFKKYNVLAGGVIKKL